MITINNLYKKYKHVIIFEDMSVVFNDAKKILIKAPNGTGKSVLLKLLVGYSRANKGEIIIDDYVLKKDRDFMDKAGVSINAVDFNKNISGLDNLLLLAKIRKIASKEDILRYVKYFEMEDMIYKKYKTYSLGTKQKMRIIQAIMDNPRYLILDEPFDALDKEMQVKTINLLNKYLEIHPQTTIIYTTHNELYQDEFADEVFEIKNRKIEKVK